MRRQCRSRSVGRARGEMERMRLGNDDAWVRWTWVTEVGSAELPKLRKLERRSKSGLVCGKAGRGSNRISSGGSKNREEIAPA